MSLEKHLLHTPIDWLSQRKPGLFALAEKGGDPIMAKIQLGNYAWYVSYGNLVSKKDEDFLPRMIKGYPKTNSHPLNKSQIRAWANCHEVLKETFKSLPHEYKNIWVVFEYVLPKHKPSSNKFLSEQHIPADVLLISKDTVLVLEFKQKKDPFVGHFRQANKYKNRIIDYHVESEEMEVKALLVLTKATGYLGESEGIPGCSPDFLGNEIVRLMGEHPKSHPNITNWLSSEFLQDPRRQGYEEEDDAPEEDEFVDDNEDEEIDFLSALKKLLDEFK